MKSNFAIDTPQPVLVVGFALERTLHDVVITFLVSGILKRIKYIPKAQQKNGKSLSPSYNILKLL
ncbi:MAG: hypothetical protein LBJ00_12820 [Planctomycetaceae bacterium]|nr:hypothetical protein [Planctomycetaceae bacterium]